MIAFGKDKVSKILDFKCRIKTSETLHTKTDTYTNTQVSNVCVCVCVLHGLMTAVLNIIHLAAVKH